MKTYLIKGKGRWCKILGEAPPGFDNGPPEWSFDLYLDEQAQKDFLSAGGDKFYLKTNKDSGETFVRFTRKATKQNGTPAQPIRVLDNHGDPWNQKTLIGNDSVLDVNYTLNEVKSKGTKRMKPSVLAVMVWDHKQYVPKSPFKTIPKDTVVVSEAPEQAVVPEGRYAAQQLGDEW